MRVELDRPRCRVRILAGVAWTCLLLGIFALWFASHRELDARSPGPGRAAPRQATQRLASLPETQPTAAR